MNPVMFDSSRIVHHSSDRQFLSFASLSSHWSTRSRPISDERCALYRLLQILIKDLRKRQRFLFRRRFTGLRSLGRFSLRSLDRE